MSAATAQATRPDNAHKQPLTVALNAMINPKIAGGVESSILSIVESCVTHDMGVHLKVLTLRESLEAMRARLGPWHEAVVWPFPQDLPTSAVAPHPFVQRLQSRLPGGRRLLQPLTRHLAERQARRHLPPPSRVDAFLAPHGAELVHFGNPVHFRTRLPYVIEPHDVQHRHYPEFFTGEELAWRERVWSQGCRDAALVVCGTGWTKADIVRQFTLDPRKVAVVPRSSVNARAVPSATRQAEILAGLNLAQGGFAFYPAMTFAHKNHLRLLEAMARLRDTDGTRIQLVCTGRAHKPFHPKVLAKVRELGLGEQVRFLGPVDEDVLATLFRNAGFLIFPSLFEGLSQSLLEALHVSLPIVAAAQSSIPETVGKAGLLFDGTDTTAIEAALRRAVSEPDLLRSLAAAAPAELARYGWDTGGPMLAACWRHAAGKPLAPDERELLARAIG